MHTTKKVVSLQSRFEIRFKDNKRKANNNKQQKKMKKVFMIFVREEVEKGDSEAYTSKKFSTPEAAHDYIKNVLEVEDKKQGIYEPDYYTVEDMTKYFQK